jgi:aspartate ammonia-lyase
MRLSVLLSWREFEPLLLDMERLLRRKALEFDKIAKVGRIGLQDSAPVTLGQEFNSYATSLQRCYLRINEAAQALHEINAGGAPSLLGGDINLLNKTAEKVSELTGLKLKPAEDYLRCCYSMLDFVGFSSCLKDLCLEFLRMGNDIRLMASGPKAGFGEIAVPSTQAEPSAVLPGVLPDKLSPVLVECLNTAACQVIGNDLVVDMAAQSGQLEGNYLMPLAAQNLLQSLDLLRNASALFNKRCLSGISADAGRCKLYLDLSGTAAVVLIQQIGADKTRDLVKQSIETGKSLKELVIEQGVMTAESWEQIVQYRALTV